MPGSSNLGALGVVVFLAASLVVRVYDKAP